MIESAPRELDLRIIFSMLPGTYSWLLRKAETVFHP
jgi:hypothetical protein